MSTFVIKIIAMFTMFCDHISYVIYDSNHLNFLNYIGRIAFFLFCFQIVIGYKKTRDLRNYFFRLIVLAIISQIPYYVIFIYLLKFRFNLNVIFGLVLGLLSLMILNIHKTKDGKVSCRDEIDLIEQYKSLPKWQSIFILIAKLFSIILICIFVYVLEKKYKCPLDYSFASILLIIAMYLFYPFSKNIKNNMKTIILYVISIISFAFYESIKYFFQGKDLKGMMVILFCIIGGFIPFLYNGKKGKSIKWITYLFYPLHLVILIIMYLVLK